MDYDPLVLFIVGLGSIGLMALASTLYVFVKLRILRSHAVNLLVAGGVGQLAALLLIVALSPILGIPLMDLFHIKLDAYFILVTAASLGLAILVLMASARIIGEEYLMKFPVETIRTLNPVVLALIVFVLAPVLEEMLFRGFFFYAFENLFNNGLIALALSSILFMFAHLRAVKLEGLTIILAIAFILGIPVLYLNTIIPSIIVHISINIIGVLKSSELVRPSQVEETGNNETFVEPRNIWI